MNKNKVKKYRGFSIEETIKNGRTVFNVFDANGDPVSIAVSSQAQAQSSIDADLDMQRGFYHD